MSEYRYSVVDVFTQTALEGNALAVFLDGGGLGDSLMQKIARELNLSETVFVFPPTRAEYSARLRIFTPFREIPFAGHPTVGTSYLLMRAGVVPAGTERFILEENVGPVPIRVETGASPLIWLTTPPIKDGPTFEKELCARAVGVPVSALLDPAPQLLSAGNPCVFIPLRDKAAVDSASPDLPAIAEIKRHYRDPLCIFPFTPTPEGAYSRMFAPDHGIHEDPATGSATGPLAAYMMRNKLAPAASGGRFVSEQGTKMGRRSLLHVQIRGENGSEGIDVGGHVVPIAEAVLHLDTAD